MARFGNATIMFHCKFYYYHYYYVEFECFSFMSGMGGYSCLLPREQFSYSVVWSIIVPSPLAQALYPLTIQHYRRTVPSGVDNNRIIYNSIKDAETRYNLHKSVVILLLSCILDFKVQQRIC